MANTYQGWAFHESLDGGKAHGTISVDRTGVTFRWDAGSVELPLNGLRIALGGAANRLVFFRHPSSVESWSVCTSDRGILKDRELATKPMLQRQLSAIGSTRRLAILIPVLMLAVIAGLLLLAYSVRGAFVRVVADRIPVEWEEKLGDTVFRQYAGEHRPVDSEEIDQGMTIILNRLREGVDDARFEFQVHVFDDPDVNAFALPGGHVVVNSGLLLAADSPEEVAGVLAHEMAHVTQRHGLRQLIGAAGLYVVVQAVLGDVSGILAVIAQQGPMLAVLKYSRDHEREADRKAFDYLVAADIDPLGLARFFEEVRGLADGNGPLGDVPDKARESLTFLSTHPDTGERVERIRALAAAETTGREWRPIGLQYGRFQSTFQKTAREPEGTPDP